MRLSLWQQFSSNHSAHFTVVGVFETLDEAQKAVVELHQIFETIEKWHRENPEKSDAWYQASQNAGWVGMASEIESALGQQYHVQWRDGIDWYAQPNINIVLDHIVLLTPRGQTYGGPQPFEQVIESLGGIGMMVGDDMSNIFGEILFDVSCDAPNEAVAVLIESEQMGKGIKVSRLNTHLRFEWDYDELGWGFYLSEFIPYLQRHNCHQISYYLQGKNYIATKRIYLNDAAKG